MLDPLPQLWRAIFLIGYCEKVAAFPLSPMLVNPLSLVGRYPVQPIVCMHTAVLCLENLVSK